VLVSASNDRQLRTVADEVQRKVAETGRKPRRREGSADTGWMLLDYGDVVVHVFSEEQRAYYALERLWADAPIVQFDEAAPAASGVGARD
jgi:ribosome-associated protein